MAAAPADFRPAGVASEKLRREVAVDLHLEPTEDILASLSSQRKAGQTIVGFAAEHGEGGLERAQLKLARKGADLIVLNDVSDPTIGFESAENEVTLVQTDGEAVLGRAPKEKIAEAILERVETIRSPLDLSPPEPPRVPARRRRAGRCLQRVILESSFLVPIRTRVVSRSGPGPLFFRLQPGMADLKEDIQHQLDDLDSQIELVAVERPGGDALRIYIDHPDGVDLALCEQASSTSCSTCSASTRWRSPRLAPSSAAPATFPRPRSSQ